MKKTTTKPARKPAAKKPALTKLTKPKRQRAGQGEFDRLLARLEPIVAELTTVTRKLTALVETMLQRFEKLANEVHAVLAEEKTRDAPANEHPEPADDVENCRRDVGVPAGKISSSRLNSDSVSAPVVEVMVKSIVPVV